MKLSIITINYNNCVGLQKTIESVKSQTFTDYEWIVIDGGSTDGSKDLIEENANRFSFWCSEPDNGIYNAMNKGINKAHGDYFQFLNSGDCLYEEETLSKAFSSDINADLIYGDFKLAGYSYVKHFPNEVTLSWFLNDSLNHQASFYKKDLFDSYRYDESYKIVSDWAFYFHLILNGATFYHIPQIIILFEPNGIGSIRTKEHEKERENALRKYIPVSMFSDIEILEKNNFIKKRNSFVKIMKFSYKFCEKIEPLLLKIDKKRHH